MNKDINDFDSQDWENILDNRIQEEVEEYEIKLEEEIQLSDRYQKELKKHYYEEF